VPSIAIIDDREDTRTTVARLLRIGLRGESWSIVESAPFEDIREYPAWFVEHEVAAVVLDERLRESGIVGYEGHDLIEFIRARWPTLPLFVVTAHTDDPGLSARFGSVEQVINRVEFGKRSKEYAARLSRAAARFTQEHEENLAKLGGLARKIAEGEATPADIAEAEAIRVQLGIQFDVEEAKSRAEGLDEFGRRVAEYERLRRKLLAALAEEEPRAKGPASRKRSPRRRKGRKE
jgi:hypothetical protein